MLKTVRSLSLINLLQINSMGDNSKIFSKYFSSRCQHYFIIISEGYTMGQIFSFILKISYELKLLQIKTKD